MKIHRLIAFHLGISLGESRPTTFDLDAASCLALNVLDVCAAMPDNLGTQVEAGNRFQVDRNSFLWPFSLEFRSVRFHVR